MKPRWDRLNVVGRNQPCFTLVKRSLEAVHEKPCPQSSLAQNKRRGFFGPVAQWLEQRTHNPLVLGSSPSGPTTHGCVFSTKFLLR